MNFPDKVTASTFRSLGYRVNQYAQHFKVTNINEKTHEVTWEYWFLTWPDECWDFDTVTARIDENGNICRNPQEIFPF